MLRTMRMIVRWNTPPGVQFWVVHDSDSESSEDEGSLPETTTTVDPPPTIAPAAVAPPLPMTVELTPSITPTLEKHLTHLKES